jgi:hypothetical protein
MLGEDKEVHSSMQVRAWLRSVIDIVASATEQGSYEVTFLLY